MAVGYSSASTPRKLRLRTAGSSDGMYAGTSCKSVRDSSVNISSNEYIGGDNGNLHKVYPYPICDPASAEAMGLIPVEMTPFDLDIKKFYETRGSHILSKAANNISPQVCARRRAQNRASQRAFRDRKEKKMRETEQKLTDLQEQHSTLVQSYQALQLEYFAIKQELEILRNQQKNETVARSVSYEVIEQNAYRGELEDPLLFDPYGLFHDPDERDRK